MFKKSVRSFAVFPIFDNLSSGKKAIVETWTKSRASRVSIQCIRGAFDNYMFKDSPRLFDTNNKFYALKKVRHFKYNKTSLKHKPKSVSCKRSSLTPLPWDSP